MKPVLVVTVYRRYWEFEANLEASRRLFGEFGEEPDVVVVWARPELGRDHLFRRLLSEKKISVLLTRREDLGDGEGASTTVPESRNIRLGLECVRDRYGGLPGGAYALVQAGDVAPRPGAYAFVDREVRSEGAAAVVFNWASSAVPDGAWHTNFFAVRLDEALWPPVAGPGEQDVLEWAWGKRLRGARGAPVCRSHNARERFFSHRHLSEGLPPFPVVPLASAGGLALHAAGSMGFWRRLWWRVTGRRCIRRGD